MRDERITVRLTAAEKEEIQKRAKSANLSTNQYLIRTALCGVPKNTRQLSILMGQLCQLENIVQCGGDLKTLKTAVNEWRQATMRIMGGSEWR